MGFNSGFKWLKTNSISTTLCAHPSKVKIISHKKRLKTNRRRYFEVSLALVQKECLVLNGNWFWHPVYFLITWQCTLSYRSVLLNYNVATKSSRMESWDDESRRVPISAHCCTPFKIPSTLRPAGHSICR